MPLDFTNPKPHTGDMAEVLICEACGSDRVMSGPFYSAHDIVCMDCGHRKSEPEINFAQTEDEQKEERAQEVMENVTETLSQELTLEMMSDPAAMAEYLAKLEAASAGLSKSGTPTGSSAGEQSQKARSPKGKKKPASPTSETENAADISLEKDLIWQSINVFTRRNASWQEVLKNAREEKEYRNDNVLVFAHSHSFGEACNDSCKQV